MERNGCGKSRKCGFTLIETIVVIAVIGVLLGFAVPSLIGWYRSAQAVRLNQTARTIFLSAQEAFTNARGTSLFAELNSQGQEVDIASQISPKPNAEELEKNAGNIRCLRLSKSGVEDAALYNALQPYLGDIGVLGDSILVEYNKATGVVRSVFYSSVASAFTYEGDVDDKTNVISREVKKLHSKQQGYYGVDYTGELGGAMTLEAPKVKLVNGERLTVEWNDVTPVANSVAVTYDLKIYENGTEVLSVADLPNLFALKVASIDVAEDTPTKGSILYKESAQGQIIFVLDCLHHSISRYGIAPGILRAEITAKMAGSPDATASSNLEHSHFQSETVKDGAAIYYLKYARHLNNMRYAAAASTFVQTAPVIDWSTAEPSPMKPENDLNFVPTRFASADSFAGRYEASPDALSGGATYAVIRGLHINPLYVDIAEKKPASNPNSYVGLFAKLDGATLENLAIDDARVAGGDHVGAFAGGAQNAAMTNCHLLSKGEPVYGAGSGDAGGGSDTDRPKPGDKWQSHFAYRVGEVVSKGNKYFKCIKDLPEGENISPDSKKGGEYWIVVGAPAAFDDSLVESTVQTPTVIPPVAPGAGGDLSALSQISSTGDYVGGLIGESKSSSYQTVSAGGVVRAGALTAAVNTALGDVGRPVLDYTLTGGANYAGGLFGAVNADQVSDAVSRGITAGQKYVGGLAGGAVKATMENLRSVGDVAGNSFVGGYFGSCDFALNNFVNESFVSGNSTVGGLTGKNTMTISNCENKGLVRAAAVSGKAGYHIGGIAGENAGSIETCKNSAAFWTPEDGAALEMPNSAWTGLPASVLLGTNVGGIAGTNTGTIADAEVSANVFGSQTVGGAVGKNSGTVAGCTFSGMAANCGIIQGQNNVGGVIGQNAAGGIFSDSANGTSAASNLLARGETVNVTLLLKVIGSGANVGGYVGLQEAGPLEDLSNYAFVSGKTNTGGVVGSTAAAVDACENRGLVQASGDAAGGVAGKTTGGLTDCVNSGRVSGFGGKYLGGIVGYLENSTAQDCTNAGLAENPGKSAGADYLGGVVGYVQSGSLKGCRNTGDVGSYKTSGNYVGGIAGGAKDSSVSDCKNGFEDDEPDDETQLILWNAGTGLGGIVGWAYSTGVADCYNYADMTETENPAQTGGIVGYLEKGRDVESCENNGEIESRAQYVGGIVGWAKTSDIEIKECTNRGSVTGKNYTGGIVGSSKAVLTGCTVEKEGSEDPDIVVTGVARVGGVAGSQEESRNPISKCESSADVLGEADYVGGIAGVCYGVTEECVMRGGEVSSSKQTNGSAMVGGLVGSSGIPTDTEGVVRNCRIDAPDKNLKIQGAGLYVGGLVGNMNGIIEGNTFNVKSILVKGGSSVGGLVGYQQTGAFRQYENGENFTVEGTSIRVGGMVGETRVDIVGLPERYIVNTASVSGLSYNVGGIVGENKVNTITIQYCENKGLVSGKDRNTGGILGGTQESTDSVVLNCINSGIVELQLGGNNSVGGIVGSVNRMTIQDCKNVGTVRNLCVKDSNSETGGIAGSVTGSVIKNCTNEGTVSSRAPSMGGIVGSAKISSSQQNSELINSRNLVDLGSENAPLHANILGGIAGAASDTQITACSNEGKLYSDGNQIGGLVGNLQAGTVVEKSENKASISGGNYTGGLAGQTAGTISNCTNSGGVTGKNPTGGLTGALLTGGVIQDSVNDGAVAGTGNVGGIAGQNKGELLSVRNLSSNKTAEILGVGSTDNVGGIAGINEGTISSGERDVRKKEGAAYGGYRTGNQMLVALETGGSVGGIAGKNTGEIVDAFNTGEVRHMASRSYDKQGGIVGLLDKDGHIDSCLNLGKLTYVGATAPRLGGLVGERAVNSGPIMESYYYAAPSDAVDSSVGAGAEYTTDDHPNVAALPAHRRLANELFNSYKVTSPKNYTDVAAVVEALSALRDCGWPDTPPPAMLSEREETSSAGSGEGSETPPTPSPEPDAGASSSGSETDEGDAKGA